MLLQNAIADALNNSEWPFPLAECIHIGGFAIGVGSIALVDFRMLNLGLRHETTARILRYTEPWTLIALVFVLFSGAALFLSQVNIYLVNLIFSAQDVCTACSAHLQLHRPQKSGDHGKSSACLEQVRSDRIPAAVGVRRVWRNFHWVPCIEVISREHRTHHPEY